ncbi:MAG: hydrogenase maturation nickel metallochaperone HypA [Calditrichaeota bacterium]|nr:MAG: hydrogenase maturation nickel metallochaperone HypA [Calditrichota bacterium]
MHELALADSIVSTVRREVERQNLPPVKTIVVRIGALSAVVPDALLFNYEVLTRDTPLERAKLVIEEVPVRARCRACRREFSVDGLVFACPECDSGQIDVIAGEELDIAYIEVEDTS